MSLTNFAKQLRMGASTVRNYEVQKCNISLALCYKLAYCLNISIDYVVGKSPIKFLKNKL